MKTDKNFRLSKTSKRMIALTKGSNQRRTDFKNAMIQAEMTAEDARRQSLRAKGSKSKDSAE